MLKRYLEKRAVRLTLVSLGWTALGLLILLPFVPYLVAKTFAPSLVRKAIQPSITGIVNVGDVTLSWFGEQRVENLAIIGDENRKDAVFASASVPHGLLSLWWSGFTKLNVTLSGQVNSTLAKDGQLGISKVLTSPQANPEPRNEPLRLPEGLELTIVVKDVDLWVEDSVRGRSYALSDLHGNLTLIQSAGTLTIKCEGSTSTGGPNGTLDLEVAVQGLKDAIALPSLGIDAVVKSTKFRVPVGDRYADMDSLSVEITANSLSQPITIRSKGVGSIASAARRGSDVVAPAVKSELDAEIAFGRLFDTTGRFVFSPATIGGKLVAANVPIALIAPLARFGDSNPIEEFVGTTSEVIERCTIERTGQKSKDRPKKGSGPVSVIQVSLVAPKATIQAEATVEGTTSLREGSLSATLKLAPETLTRWCGSDVHAGTALKVTGERLAWTSPQGSTPPLEAISGSIRVETLSDLAITHEFPATAERAARKLLASLGAGSSIAIDCADTTSPISATLALKAGYGVGGDGDPTMSPEKPTVVGDVKVDRSFRRLDVSELAVSLPVVPKAIESFLNGQSLDGAGTLSIALPHASIPLRGSSESASAGIQIAEIAASARVRVDGALQLSAERLSHPVRLDGFSVNLESERIGTGLSIKSDATIDGAEVKLEAQLAGMSEATDFSDWQTMLAHASLTLADDKSAALTAWAPGVADFARSLGLAHGTLALRVSERGEGSRRKVAVEGGLGQPLRLAIEGALDREALRIDSLAVNANLTPEMLATLQGETTSEAGRVGLTRPTDLLLRAEEPVNLDFEALARGELPTAKLVLTSSACDLRSIPGVAEPVSVRDLSLTALTDPKARKVGVTGRLSLSGSGTDDRIKNVALDLSWTSDDAGEVDSPLRGVQGNVTAEGVSVGWIERLLARPAGSIAVWTGSTGSLRAEFARAETGETIRLTPAFPRVTGKLDAVAADGDLTLTASELSASVPAAELSALQTRASTGHPVACQFANDLRVKVPTATFRLPRWRAGGRESIARASVDLSIRVDSVDVSVPTKEGGRETLGVPPLRITLQSNELAQQVSFNVRGDGAAGGAARGTMLKVSGDARSIMDASGALTPEAATFNLESDVQSIPTALVELFAGTGGSLARQIGERLSLKATVTSSSRGSRSLLQAELGSDYLDVKVPGLEIVQGKLQLSEARPIEATFALSPGIKEDVLYAINPLFGDIALESKRATFRLTSLDCPLDGNLAKLDADFALEIGDVKLSGDKPICILFALVKGGFTPGADARIEPFVGKIRNGHLTYRDFGVKLFRNSAAQSGDEQWKVAVGMEGDVSLGTKPMHVDGISAGIPLSVFVDATQQAARLIGGIGGLDSEVAKKVSIGVLMYGDLYDAQGRPKELEQKVTVPGLDEVLNPENLLKWGIKEGATRGLEGIIPKP